jgi:hypothetical protein
MSEKSPCGKHVDLVSNGSVRVTQCPCGTLHVTLAASGVTVRMNEETFRIATSAFVAARDKLSDSARPTIN